jgi:PAS domain S-box-containing protein
MGTFGISKDITPFKKLEIEAREKNEKLEQRLKELEKTRKKAELRENELNGLNELIDQFVWKAELDDQGKIVSANDLLLQHTGLKENQAKGKNITELMDDPGQLDDLWERVRQKENQKSRLKFNIKQGKATELVASLIPLTNEDNDFSGVLFVGYSPSSNDS